MIKSPRLRLAVSRICLIVSPLVISGCTSAALDPAENSIRSGLTIEKSALPSELTYPSTGECRYRADISMAEGPREANDLKITFRSVNDKIYLVFKNGEKTSGYLIGHSGRLYDFNAESELSPDTYNPETKERVSQEHINRMKNSSDPLHHVNPHALNDFELEFPEYLPGRRSPGEIAAYVRSEDGAVWGNYQYIGIAHYRGATVAVFDLLRNLPGKAAVVGYTLVDTRTGMPMHLAFRSGSTISLEQISCN